VARLLATYPEHPRVIALGDAPMDAEFLALADIPVIIRAKSGFPNSQLLAEIPGAIVTALPGPAGWSATLLEILDREKAHGSRGST
jgi:mannosyl-3-phosphoglycerate phosphatase